MLCTMLSVDICIFFFYYKSSPEARKLSSSSHSSAFTSQLVRKFVAQPVPRWLVKLLPKWTPKEVMGVLSLSFSRMHAHTYAHTNQVDIFLSETMGWMIWVISGQWAVGLSTPTPMDPAPSRGLDYITFNVFSHYKILWF